MRFVVALFGVGVLSGPVVAFGQQQSYPAETLSPEGPATLRRTWLGAVPAIAYGPRVIVAWRVSVGHGGNPGPVALRVLRPGGASAATATATSRFVDLPAIAGTYEFPSRLRFLDGDDLGLDQRRGGHAVLHTHPPGDGGDTPRTDHSRLNAVDVWRPPLAHGASGEMAERIMGRRLLVEVELERDRDADGRGDLTQDPTDLSLTASARYVGRRTIRLRIVMTNRHRRTAGAPQLSTNLDRRWRVTRLRTPPCPGEPRGRCTGWIDSRQRGWYLPALRPGRSHVVEVDFVPSRRRRIVLRVAASAEGPDRTPARRTLMPRRSG